jgi:hypothetical protein
MNPSKVLEFFQIYINFSAVCEQNFWIFYLVDKSKIFKFTMYFTNYFLVESLVFVFATNLRCPVGKVLCCWSSVCFITMAFSRLCFLNSSWLNIVFPFSDIFSLSLANEYPSLSNAIVFSFKKFSNLVYGIKDCLV